MDPIQLNTNKTPLSPACAPATDTLAIPPQVQAAEPREMAMARQAGRTAADALQAAAAAPQVQSAAAAPQVAALAAPVIIALALVDQPFVHYDWSSNMEGREACLKWQDEAFMTLPRGIAQAHINTTKALLKLGVCCVRPNRCKKDRVCLCTDEERCQAVFHGNMEDSPTLEDVASVIRPKMKYPDHVLPAVGAIDEPHRAHFAEGVIRSGKTIIECYGPLLCDWAPVWAAQNGLIKTQKRFAIVAPNKCLIDNFLKEGLGLSGGTAEEDAEVIAALKTKTICTRFKVPPEVVLAYNKTVFVMRKDDSGNKIVTDKRLRTALAGAKVVVATIGKFLSALEADKKLAPQRRLLGPRSFAVFLADEAHKGMQYPLSPFCSEGSMKAQTGKSGKEWKTLYTAFPNAVVVKFSGSRSKEDLKMQTAARSTFAEVYDAKRVVAARLITFSHGGVARANGNGVHSEYIDAHREYLAWKLLREDPGLMLTVILEAWEILRTMRTKTGLPLVMMVRCPTWPAGGMAQFTDMIQKMMAQQCADAPDGLECTVTGLPPRIVGTWSDANDHQLTAHQKNLPGLNMSQEQQEKHQGAIRFGAKADILLVCNQCTEGYDNASVKMTVDLRGAAHCWDSAQSQMQFELRGIGTLDNTEQHCSILKAAAFWHIIEKHDCDHCRDCFASACEEEATNGRGLGNDAPTDGLMCSTCAPDATALGKSYCEALALYTWDQQVCAIAHPSILDQGNGGVALNQMDWFANQSYVPEEVEQRHLRNAHHNAESQKVMDQVRELQRLATEREETAAAAREAAEAATLEAAADDSDYDPDLDDEGGGGGGGGGCGGGGGGGGCCCCGGGGDDGAFSSATARADASTPPDPSNSMGCCGTAAPWSAKSSALRSEPGASLAGASPAGASPAGASLAGGALSGAALSGPGAAAPEAEGTPSSRAAPRDAWIPTPTPFSTTPLTCSPPAPCGPCCSCGAAGAPPSPFAPSPFAPSPFAPSPPSPSRSPSPRSRSFLRLLLRLRLRLRLLLLLLRLRRRLSLSLSRSLSPSLVRSRSRSRSRERECEGERRRRPSFDLALSSSRSPSNPDGCTTNLREGEGSLEAGQNRWVGGVGG